jgi:signal transduction histidine kinase
MFGGTLEVASAPGKGTAVRATLPFDKSKDRP